MPDQRFSFADPAGRLLVGSVFYDPSGDYPLGKLILVDTDGTARIIDEGFHMANGLGFSPDNKTLYFTDSAARPSSLMTTMRATGDARNLVVVLKFPRQVDYQMAWTVDAAGFVWSAEWYGSSCPLRPRRKDRASHRHAS